jgi:hypothetical protein
MTRPNSVWMAWMAGWDGGVLDRIDPTRAPPVAVSDQRSGRSLKRTSVIRLLLERNAILLVEARYAHKDLILRMERNRSPCERRQEQRLGDMPSSINQRCKGRTKFACSSSTLKKKVIPHRILESRIPIW